MTEQTLNKRLEQLEAHVSDQDRTIEELNAALTSQWIQIDKLKRELAGLTDQMQDMEHTVGTPQRGEKPPHY